MRFQKQIQFIANHAGLNRNSFFNRVETQDFGKILRNIDYNSVTYRLSGQRSSRRSWRNRNLMLPRKPNQITIYAIVLGTATAFGLIRYTEASVE